MGAGAKAFIEEQTPEFTPMPWSLGEIRAAIPARLFERKNSTSIYYLVRDIVLASLAWEAATWIDPLCSTLGSAYPHQPTAVTIVKASAWLT